MSLPTPTTARVELLIYWRIVFRGPFVEISCLSLHHLDPNSDVVLTRDFLNQRELEIFHQQASTTIEILVGG
jgi:hypothetical protein